MEQIFSSEGDNLSISQEILCLNIQELLFSCSAEPANGLHPQPVESNPHPHLFRIKFNIILPVTCKSCFQVINIRTSYLP
jgi:hypothetical protein